MRATAEGQPTVGKKPAKMCVNAGFVLADGDSMAIKHAISRKMYWRMSRTPALRYAMPNKWPKQEGWLSLKQLWYERASLRGTA